MPKSSNEPATDTQTANARGASARPSSSLIDPATLMRIKNLQVRARVVVTGFLKGIHRSPYHGFSVEFSEYREYSVGDDPRYLDWRLYAKSDRYYIKRFEDETNRRCYLIVDNSRSMGYGTLGYSKAEYTRTTAATLAYFLNTQRDAVGLLTFENTITDYLPARHRPGHMRRIMAILAREPQGKATNLTDPLDQIAATVQKRGLVVLLSDLLAPAEPLKARLGYLRSRGHEVVVLRILDPAEVNFSFESAALFRDAESGRDLYVDPAESRASYLKKFAAHNAAIAQTCLDLGVDYELVTTDRPLELVLFDLLRARARRGRSTNRRAASGRGGVV